MTYKQHHKNEKLTNEVIIKHNDLYTRAWEYEYETHISHNGQHEPNNDDSPEISVRHNLTNGETCTNPGTIQEDSPEIFPHTDEVVDGTDTDQYMEPDAEANSEQLNPAVINPRSTKFDLCHNLKSNCNDDYSF